MRFEAIPRLHLLFCKGNPMIHAMFCLHEIIEHRKHHAIRVKLAITLAGIAWIQKLITIIQPRILNDVSDRIIHACLKDILPCYLRKQAFLDVIVRQLISDKNTTIVLHIRPKHSKIRNLFAFLVVVLSQPVNNTPLVIIRVNVLRSNIMSIALINIGSNMSEHIHSRHMPNKEAYRKRPLYIVESVSRDNKALLRQKTFENFSEFCKVWGL